MAREHILQPLGEDHVERGAQGEQQVLRRSAAVFVVMRFAVAEGPLPVGRAHVRVLCASRALGPAAANERPDGVISPFWEPAIATSTPHLSISNGMHPSDATASTSSSASLPAPSRALRWLRC